MVSQANGSRYDLDEIVQTVFLTMTGLTLQPAGNAGWEPRTDRLTAVIHLAGAWKGRVLVETSVRQACRLTSLITGVVEPSGLNDDVRDALGEVANMVGGNLKSFLGRGVELSMPLVVEGSHYTGELRGGHLVTRAGYRCGVGVLWVTIIGNESV